MKKSINICLWFLLLVFLSNSLEAKEKEKEKFKYELSIVSLFRDEARFLKEWIEFHRMVGVEHFYLYNHLSQDDYLEVLQPYIDKGIVELFEIKKEPHEYQQWHNLQNSCYNKTIKKARNVSHWLAIIDSDEFLVPVKDKNLLKLLKDYESFGGLMVNWQMYGTSDVWEIPSDKLMIETLMKRAHDEYSFHYHVKSIIQPLRTASVDTPHKCRFIKPFFAVNSNKVKASEIAKNRIQVSEIILDRVRVNHYWTRDEKFLQEVKNGRLQQWNNKEKVERMNKANEMNVIEDPVMDRFVPDLRQRMGL